MPRRRGFFEFIKDILVSATTAIGTAIETFYQMMTKGTYDKENAKINDLINKMQEYREGTEKNVSEVRNFNHDNPDNTERTNMPEIYSNIEEYKNAIISNTDNVIKMYTDDIFNNKKFSHTFVSGDKKYVFTSSLSEDFKSNIDIKDKQTNKSIYSCVATIEKNNQGLNNLVISNEAFHVTSLDELNIIDKSKTLTITPEQFFKGIQEEAEKTFNQGKIYFAYNGHLFNVRKDNTNQFVVFTTSSNLVGKWAEGVSLFENGYKSINREENKKLFESLLCTGKKSFNDKEPQTKKEFEEVLKQQGARFLSIDEKNIKVKFYDKKKNEEREVTIDKKTGKSKGWIPTTIKAYILNNSTIIPTLYENPNFDINKLILHIQENDKNLIEKEMQKIKTTTEIFEATEAIKKANFPEKATLINKLEKMQEEMDMTVVSLIKDKLPNAPEDIKNFLSKYDDIDSLNALKDKVLANETIPNDSKDAFVKECEKQLQNIPEKQSKTIIDETFTSSKLIVLSTHLDKNIANKAQEELQMIVKNAANFALDCAFANKQEDLETKLPHMLERIDDKKTFDDFKTIVENECFMGDNMQELFSRICDEKEDEIKTTSDTPNIGTEDISL